jgi:hypothetical protein
MTRALSIGGMADVTHALQVMAKRLGLSITALVDTGGVTNGSLIGIGTGTATNKDMSIGPLLRVLNAVDYELVGRARSTTGLVVEPVGGLPMRVFGPDGGRLEAGVDSLKDLPLLLNTMAAANWLTITALVKASGLRGGSLVAIARGTAGPEPDARLSGLVMVAQQAQFELLIRPIHRSMREARIALAPGRR